MNLSGALALKSLTLKQNSCSLRFFEFDDEGVPLVMLHGLGCASSFEYPALARSTPLTGRHVFLVDLLGFGYSDQPESFGYRVSDHAETIVEFADAIQLERFDLYGHSMGGTIAIEAADLLGDRVRSLILSEANLDSGGGLFSRDIAAAGEEAYVTSIHAKTITDAIQSGNHDWATTMRVSCPRAVYLGALSLVQGGQQSWRDVFYRHPARKSFIFGEHSLPDVDFDVLQKEGIEIYIVPKAGHSMGVENPIGLAECIGQAIN